MGKRKLAKRGMTLLEVMIAAVILGIMTVSGGSYFVHAAKLRMHVRAMQAATIEANSLMESAYGTLTESSYGNGTGYFDRDMNYSSTDPNDQWQFDGLPYDVTVLVTDAAGSSADNPAVDVTVTVEYDDARPPIVLTAYRHCGEN